MSILHELQQSLGIFSHQAARASQRPEGNTQIRALEESALRMNRALDMLRLRNDHLRRQFGEAGLLDQSIFMEEISRLHTIVDTFPMAHKHNFFQAAVALTDCGSDDVAFQLLRRVLASLPGFEEGRRLMERIASRAGEPAAKARTYLNAANVIRLGAFGQGCFRGKPYANAFDLQNQRIYVSDLGHAAIHSFDPNGDNHRVIEGSWNSNWGIGWGEGQLWICDCEGATLQAITPEAGTTFQLDIPSFLDGASACVKPEFVCQLNGRIYLLTSQRPLRSATVVSFIPDSPRETLVIYDELPLLNGAGGITAHQGCVYVSSHSPATLFRLVPDTRQASIVCPLPPDYVYNIASGGGHIYATHNTGLTKVRTDGEHIYTIRPGIILDQTTYCGVTTWERNGKNTLYLADYANKTILPLET